MEIPIWKTSTHLSSVIQEISSACIKQLLDEVEHDSKNYQGQGLYYLPKLKTKADNTDRGLDNLAIMQKCKYQVFY